MPKLVFLATDLALYGLLVAIAFYVWHALRTPTLRQTWRSVLHDPVAMPAAVVLLVFLALAALDSVHFRSLLPPAPGAAADAAPAYSTRTLSVLDALLTGPREAREKTYSVPLGTHQFSKESMLVNGKSVRDYPRLVFGGAHLKDVDGEWAADVARRSVTGLAGGAVGAAALWLAVAALRARSARTGVLRVAACDLAADHGHSLAIDPADGIGAGALRRMGRGAVAGVPRVRHGPDRQRRPVPGDQVDPHRGRDRLARHARHAAVRDRVRHPRGLLQGPHRRCHPVPVHDAVVDPFGAADRCVRADDPGLRRQESADVRDRPGARRHPPVPALGDPGPHRLGGARPAAARGNAEAVGARLRAGRARVRRVEPRHHAPPHPARTSRTSC